MSVVPNNRYMKKSNLLTFMLLISLLLSFTSCTGDGDAETAEEFGVKTAAVEDDDDDDSSDDSTTTTTTTTNYDDVVFAGITAATTLTDTKVRVSFLPASGGSSVFAYRVYLDGDYSTPYQVLATGSVTDNNGTLEGVIRGLTASTAYAFTVRAYDAAQNEEDTNTDSESATTNSAGGTFTGIDSIGSVSSGSMTLSWTDFSSEAGYKIYNMSSGSPVYVATVAQNATSYEISGLTPSTSYTWRVRIVDGAGDEDANTNDVAQTTDDALTFPGIVSASQLTSVSLRLNWASLAGATLYKVYQDSGSGMVELGTTTSIFYDVTGLTAGASYDFRARAMDSDGNWDTNTTDLTQVMPTTTMTFNGWTNAKSVGERVHFDSSKGTAGVLEDGIVELSWRESTSSGAAITGYNIYYSTAPDGTFTKLNGSAISTGVVGEDIEYTVDESLLTAGTAYYYKVSVIVGGSEYFHEATSPTDHTIIRVIYPHDNVALVHRWIANGDMCDEIGRGLALTVAAAGANDVDVENHYRCKYNGLAHTYDATAADYFYDLGTDLLVDVNEVGCNVSKSACTSHSVGATAGVTDCVDDADPDSNMEAAQFSVHYTKKSATYGCFIQEDATASTPDWKSVESMIVSDINYNGLNYGNYIYGNKAGLPPMGNITQEKAYEVCQTQVQTYTLPNGVGGFTAGGYRKRLLGNKEWVAAAAYDPSMSASSINTIDRGGSGVAGCISTGGYTTAYDLDKQRWPGNHSSHYIGVTGDTFSNGCRSRYGVQDMGGNMYEWTGDQLLANASRQLEGDSTPYQDYGFTGDWVASNGDYFFTDDAATANRFAYVSASWITLTNATHALFYNPMIGLDLTCDGTACDNGTDDNTLVSTLSSGGTYLNDYYNPNASLYRKFESATANTANGLIRGGQTNSWGWYSGTLIGAWYASSYDYYTVGARCTTAVPSDDF